MGVANGAVYHASEAADGTRRPKSVTVPFGPACAGFAKASHHSLANIGMGK